MSVLFSLNLQHLDGKECAYIPHLAISLLRAYSYRFSSTRRYISFLFFFVGRIRRFRDWFLRCWAYGMRSMKLPDSLRLDHPLQSDCGRLLSLYHSVCAMQLSERPSILFSLLSICPMLGAQFDSPICVLSAGFPLLPSCFQSQYVLQCNSLRVTYLRA